MKKIFSFTILLITMITISGSAQIIEKSLDARNYEAVVKLMSDFNQFFGLPIAELYLYSYDKVLTEWRAVPFQIDERNASHNYFGIDDGLVNEHDELVFMARDAGDKVPDGYWLADIDSRNTVRFEIEIHDTLRDGQKGWVYLFHSNTINDYSTEDYIGHSFDTELVISDKIVSKYYEVYFWSLNGLPAWELVTQAGGGSGNGDNVSESRITDRFKIRLKMADVKAFGFSVEGITLTEENILQIGNPQIINEDPQIMDKKVRLIRNLRVIIKFTARIHLGLGIYREETVETAPFNIPIYFYPFNYHIQSDKFDLNIPDVSMKVRLIRTSKDLYGQNANGMIFYNKYLRSLPDSANNYANLINGSGGPLSDLLNLDVPGLNWHLVSGDQGSIFSTTNVPDIGDYQLLYYIDDMSTSAAKIGWDGTYDTGANGSWGDSGVAIFGSNIQGEFKLLIDNYFLPANQSVTIGETLNENIKNPVEVSPLPQLFDRIPPGKVNLIAAFPESDTAITLTWIASGDDNFSGKVNRYEIGYSSFGPEEGQEELWFNSIATIAAELPEPQNAGSQESYTLNGLNPATNYFFAIKAYDESNNGTGNASLISNIISRLTLDVELVSFAAEVNLNSVTLFWHTASEDNNLGFEIQRKKEGQNYKTIAFVSGNGTTAESHYYSFTDVEIPAGFYFYRLKQIDVNGSVFFHPEIQLTIAPPLAFALHQNYPNPFNPTTTLVYDLAEDVPVRLVVYNIKGQVVNIVVNSTKKAGRYQVLINGSLWPSGIYFVHLTAGIHSFVNKMILLE